MSCSIRQLAGVGVVVVVLDVVVKIVVVMVVVTEIVDIISLHLTKVCLMQFTEIK